MKRLMMSILTAAMAIGWAAPASADVANDDCGAKMTGDACTTFDMKTGVCVSDDAGALYCDTTKGATTTTSGTGTGSGTGSGGSAPSGDSSGSSGCTVGQIGGGGRAEAVALGLLFAACVAMRRRRD